MTELQDVQQQIAEAGRKAAAVQQRMEQIRPAATSPDGAVTVTVSAAGTLEDIRFGAVARGMDLDKVSSLIMRTATEAHRVAAVQMQEALADLTGPGSTPVLEMGQFIPPAADEFAAEPDRPAPVADSDPEDDGFTGRGLS